ncbi:MFS transporter [Priestia aryabhattai]|uniref:MFS transporter n=2 Tax=Priestia aryabhattai TaxID=412384 RepID=UPI000BF80F02|nr:MFS transporter [Priestia aryabhattai]MED3958715.1 MFS transporter [Priestia aryabhattai]MED3989261.1 MFS transporter [Priestia aryabhattai]MED4008966.1 MFS transporter [Priestia aryabhattai]PGA16366.1 MFS transporter [Priestia aryabhattai]
MSQNNPAVASDKQGLSVPKYLIMAILTLFSIGPQYFLNLSYTVNQVLIQNRFDASTQSLLLPSIISNLAFGLGVPIGPMLAKKYGVRKAYLTFVLVFLAGSIINVFSENVAFLSLGRLIQGLSSGMLFLTIIPAALISFPNKIRNFFLVLAIGGLFGSTAIGAFLGAVSLSMDNWRWVFVLGILASLVSLFIGYKVLPAHDPTQQEDRPVDKKSIFILSLIMILLVYPLYELRYEGFASIQVWPFLLAAAGLVVIFVLVDLAAENPLVPLKSLLAVKPVAGTIMAIGGHMAYILAIAGINGVMQNVQNASYTTLSYFYLYFFVGVLISAFATTFLYDKFGPGYLGAIGSLLIVIVGFSWVNVSADTSLVSLYVHIMLFGMGVSMALVSGALGAALAGDLHQASMRSISLHSIRNLLGAIVAPVIGWFVVRQNAIYYEDFRGQISSVDPQVKMQLSEMIKRYMGMGMSQADAKTSAVTAVVAGAKKASILHAYHNLFFMLGILGVIMLIASLSKAWSGENRILVQKEEVQEEAEPREERKMLPAPQTEETSV